MTVVHRSGLPMPRRRTFAAGILPCAHSMLLSLRRAPIAAGGLVVASLDQQGRLSVHGQPLTTPFPVAQFANLCRITTDAAAGAG